MVFCPIFERYIAFVFLNRHATFVKEKTKAIDVGAENEDLNQHVEKLEGEEDILRCRIKQILSVVADKVWKK